MIDVAAEEAQRQGGGRVVVLHMKLGPLSGVIPDALRSAWELACEASPLAGCRLEIQEVPITIDCPLCGVVRPVRSVQEICCSHCGTPAEVVTGREMDIIALELIDEKPAES